MKVLSVKPRWAMKIATGQKLVECRSWKTDYRGPLLICASAEPWVSGTICKHAIAVAFLAEIVPFKEEHLDLACMDEMPAEEGKEFYAWVFNSVVPVVPFEQKGQLRLFEVPDDEIYPMMAEENPAEFFREFFEPLMKFGDKDTTEEQERKKWNDLLAWYDIDRE